MLNVENARPCCSKLCLPPYHCCIISSFDNECKAVWMKVASSSKFPSFPCQTSRHIWHSASLFGTWNDLLLCTHMAWPCGSDGLNLIEPNTIRGNNCPIGYHGEPVLYSLQWPVQMENVEEEQKNSGGVIKLVSSVPLVSDFFSIVKTHVNYWISP